MSNRSLHIRFRDSRLGPTIEKPRPLTLPEEHAGSCGMPTLESLRGDSVKSLSSSVNSSSDDSRRSFASHEMIPLECTLGQRRETSRRRLPRSPPRGRIMHSHNTYPRRDFAQRPSGRHVSPRIAEKEEAVYIEIAPGVTTRLRGAQETWQCVENDYYTPTTCYGCNSDICCILDASFVLCPSCKVVSPLLLLVGNNAQQGQPPQGGGVGLGFTMENLRQWQHEILSQRRCRSSETIMRAYY